METFDLILKIFVISILIIVYTDYKITQDSLKKLKKENLIYKSKI